MVVLAGGAVCLAEACAVSAAVLVEGAAGGTDAGAALARDLVGGMVVGAVA